MQLTPELRAKVCTCTSRFNISGWSLEPSTGYWVHRFRPPGAKDEPCGKPSRFCSIFECDGCDQVFFATSPITGISVLCPECKEWE